MDYAASNNLQQMQDIKKQTEMESLGASLSHALNRLRDHNERASEMVHRFCNEPRPAPPPINAPAQIGPAEPIPGTLASLTSLAQNINIETDRFENLSIKLRGIL